MNVHGMFGGGVNAAGRRQAAPVYDAESGLPLCRFGTRNTDAR